MIKLTHLAHKYGTDKVGHGYIPHFEKHLPNKAERILEIGCLTGSSLRMWREAYPMAEIHCLDLFKEHRPPTDIPGIIYWEGSQTDQYVLEQIRRLDFTFITEDASHDSISSWVTFNSLMGCCETYCLEDLHCSGFEPYRQGLRFEQTVLGRMKINRFPFDFDLYDDKIAFIYPNK